MKYALVTGGSRGIGRAICSKLAEMGFYVLVNYNSSPDEAATTLNLVKEKGSDGELLKFDVSRQEEVETGINEWQARNEGKVIQILINNAGITRDTLLMRMTEDQWDSVIAVNLKSVFNLTKAVLMTMIKQKGGSIVNMSSVVGVSGNAGQSHVQALVFH